MAMDHALQDLPERWTQVIERAVVPEKRRLEDRLPLLVLHLDAPQPCHFFPIPDELGRNPLCMLCRRFIVGEIDTNVVDVTATPVPQVEEVVAHECKYRVCE